MVKETAPWEDRADELHDKHLVTEDQKDTLKEMVASSDPENAVLAEELIRLKISDKLIEGLNDGQTQAFIDIIDFYRDPQGDEAFVLKGYAGTGKTYLVRRILEYITAGYPNRRIAITAPTNKAVHVLRSGAPFSSESTDKPVFQDLFKTKDRMEYKTIHKLLGLKEQITANGQQLFKADGKNKSDLRNFKYLIVDEVSMLDDTLCTDILEHHESVKILFMGDPAQIPPISKSDCIPFRDNHDHKFKHAELTEIMRQKGDHPVVDASFHIRNNLNEKQPIPVLKTELNEQGHGIHYFHSKEDRKEIRPILEEYFTCEEFATDANYAKVIAWRNKTVNRMNEIIRELLYGPDADPYMLGEKLIAGKPIFTKTGGRFGPQWTIQFHTSEEMQVVDVKKVGKKYDEDGFKLSADMWQCKVEIWDPIANKSCTDFIHIMHEDSIEEHQALLKEAKDIAIQFREARRWVTYFNIMKWSAAVAYNYAITAHKAQGSTYKNVLLLEEDLDHNRKVLERNRIKYTAYSRPTDKLFILRENYG